MSNAVPKNCISEVCNVPDNAALAKSEEKLQLIMACMASRAHSRSWKMLDDTEHSLPALRNISHDAAKCVCHLCGTRETHKEGAGNAHASDGWEHR